MQKRTQPRFLNGVRHHLIICVFFNSANRMSATAFIFTGYVLSFAVDLMDDEDDYYHSSHKYHQLEMNTAF